MKKHSQYPKSDPVGMEGGKTSDEKIKERLEGWKSWGEKMKFLKEIHNEKSVINGINLVRMRYGDELIGGTLNNDDWSYYGC